MIFDNEGYLYAATGKEGKILKISPEGKGETWFDSPAVNILTLRMTEGGVLIAGTQGEAFIYRINDKDDAFVLYAPDQNEVRDLVVLEDATIYAAINGIQTPRGALMEQIMKNSYPPNL